MAESQWMSIVEYARTFNVSDMTVRRRIKTGRLQAVLREGKYYIPSEGRNTLTQENEEPRALPKQQIPKEFRPQSRQYDNLQPTKQYESLHSTPERRAAPLPRVDYQRPMETYESRQVESPQRVSDLHRMIDVCESAVKSFSNLESKLEENYRTKLQLLEGKLLAKDRELEQLNQKIQDLQLLVSILEKRRS